ncbi:ORF58 [Alcelaphine gammaherpesvirus 1]|uniref:Gene 58 protein n=1 Tax=Alcelaphine herpesvirus 1 (strain C500) TaxID=654901 RepID=VG58_ALHV1|nr:ORF58 [Alcelaphine gammaherpesvirus 1]O36408.1 RecName: Full=Gene 58 protein [Alcelaphine herpesvirus 1 strain C500]AAC58105.1 ORF58 [Alcelaphine gammaherpesvirus 1]APB09481.1 envelope protein UL43 [Alcelaphine gammaherpesvirus 1]APB09553.1 envelope protein UL43 [Alcelaphine gammaherpesvirus 1]
MTKSVDYQLIAATFSTGLLASSSIVWSYIFATVFSFSSMLTWQSVLYVWSLPIVQLAAIFCAVRVNFSRLGLLLLLNCGIAFLSFISWSLNWSISVLVPGLFVINFLSLMIWLIVCFDVVYLCPEIYHKYFELGFLASLTIHYCFNQFEIYLTNVMFAPFFICMLFGYIGFSHVWRHDMYIFGKMRCKPIYYTKRAKYIAFSAWQIMDVALFELICLWFLLLAMAAGCIALVMFSEVFLGVSTYLYLFMVGNFCCGSLIIYRSYVMTAVYSVVSLTAFFLILMGGYLFTKAQLSMLAAVMFFCYFHANGCLLYRIKKKLHRNITTPRFILNVCMLLNALLEITVLLAQKLT